VNLPSSVKVSEVVTRDGFQSEAQTIPTDQKVGLINKLSTTGLRRIEITSFVHPRFVPQLADAEEVYRRIERPTGVEFIALVPNLKGAERAVACGVKEINVVFSASEAHNRSNVRMSVAESLENVGKIVELAREYGIKVNGALATAFGCPFEGAVTVQQVMRLVKEYLAMGVASVSFADTTGMANPKQVYDLVSRILDRWPDQEFSLHFHNTRGTGLANVVAGLQAGITSYDASLGGLGGCPFAPGAMGNICTEDLVHMLHEMGIKTGIDLDKLIAVARYLQELLGRPLPGQVMKAGKVSDLHPLLPS